MPTRRMIDPAFWKSESLAKISREDRFFFVGLISNADDQGRIRGHPAILRAEIYPFDDVSFSEIERQIEALSAIDCICVYKLGDKTIIQITNWWLYQSPQWAYPSKLPPPDGWQDRLRYRENNKVLTDNWDGDGGFRQEHSDDDYANLPKPLPKDLPKGEKTAIELGLELELESDNISGKPQKQFSPKQKTILALASICRIDLKMATDKSFGQLGQTAEKLIKAKRTPKQIDAFGEWWYQYDWRGEKGQPPIPAQVLDTWGTYEHWLQNGKGHVNGANKDTRHHLTPEQAAAARKRDKEATGDPRPP